MCNHSCIPMQSSVVENYYRLLSVTCLCECSCQGVIWVGRNTLPCSDQVQVKRIVIKVLCGVREQSIHFMNHLTSPVPASCPSPVPASCTGPIPASISHLPVASVVAVGETDGKIRQCQAQVSLFPITKIIGSFVGVTYGGDGPGNGLGQRKDACSR